MRYTDRQNSSQSEATFAVNHYGEMGQAGTIDRRTHGAEQETLRLLPLKGFYEQVKRNRQKHCGENY
jgi:hypothetical protein